LLSNELLETLADRDASRSEIEVTQRGRALHACLNQFSAEHRELLLVPHRSTDSVVEIAQRQEKSPNALYKLLGRLWYLTTVPGSQEESSLAVHR
jgi:hypothetical protein